MKPLISIIIILLLVSCSQPYNDVKDYGLNGKVKKAIMTEYPDPIESSGEWKYSEEPLFTRTMIFDDKGMISEEIFQLRKTSYTRKYSLNGDRKVSCVESGDNQGQAKFYYAGSTITENFYDEAGLLKYEAKTFFDNSKLTTKEIYRHYDSRGKITGSTTAIFTGRTNGFIDKFTYTDSINNITNHYELITLSKDNKNNPIKVLKKKDGKPESIKTYSYEYD